jgi:hypothetical protein
MLIQVRHVADLRHDGTLLEKSVSIYQSRVCHTLVFTVMKPLFRMLSDYKTSVKFQHLGSHDVWIPLQLWVRVRRLHSRIWCPVIITTPGSPILGAGPKCGSHCIRRN